MDVGGRQCREQIVEGFEMFDGLIKSISRVSNLYTRQNQSSLTTLIFYLLILMEFKM